ncbi:MAG: hypothetical protein Q7S61_00780 [bacterium]|nr:hypothetical protein [bacterium]
MGKNCSVESINGTLQDGERGEKGSTVEMIPYSKRSVGEIKKDLRSGKKFSDISLIHGILVLDDGSPLLRGDIENIGDKKESVHHAVCRHLNSTPFRPINYVNKGQTEKYIDATGVYSDGKVNIYTSLVEVNNPYSSTLIDGDDKKFQSVDPRIITLFLRTYDSDKSQQSNGYSDEERKKRVMYEALGYGLINADTSIKCRVLDVINAGRAHSGQQEAANLDELDPEQVLTTYEQIKRSDLFREFRRKEMDPNKLERAYLQLRKKRILLKDDSTIKDTWMKTYWIHNMQGIDLLMMAQVMADSGTDSLKYIAAKTTHGIVDSMRFLRDVYRSSLSEALKELPSNIFSSTETGERLMKDMPVVQLKKFDDTLSSHICKMFAKQFDLDPQDVTDVKEEVNKLISSDMEEALASESEFPTYRQLHKITNEVQNASLAFLFHQSLGLLPYDDERGSPEGRKLIQFEASRSLAFIMKGLSVYKEYKRIKKAGSFFFQHSINHIFGPIKEIVQKEINGNGHGNKELRTLYHRAGVPDLGEVWVDTKPTKSFGSYLRKSLEAKTEDIGDVYSTNIALFTSEDKPDFNRDFVETEIARVNRAVEELIQNFHIEYGEFYDIRIFGHRDTYKNLLNYFNSDSDKTDYSSGKRAGSKGDSLIRDKFQVTLSAKKNSSEQYRCEFVFYPFANLADVTDGKFMGLFDKLGDDPRYAKGRILSTLTVEGKHLHGPLSFYEASYPSHIYGFANAVKSNGNGH